LEKGRRPVPPRLARKVVRLFKLNPGLLPASGKALSSRTLDELARDLSRLGYPGFTHLRGRQMKNPAEVLLSALARPDLDPRVAEALPWLLLKYPELDRDWLLKQARMSNLTNRLGFVVDLARLVLEKRNETDSARYHALSRLADSLRPSRLDVEDTLGQDSLTKAERAWLRENRSEQARFWHLLSDWRPEFLQVVE